MKLLVVTLLVLVPVAIFLPKIGIGGRWRKARELAARVSREDALKYIYKAQINNRRPTVHSIAGALNIHSNRAAALLAEMERRGLLTFVSGELQLSGVGRELALHVIRAHRLWEHYLAECTGAPEREWHNQADVREHQLTRQEVDELSAKLGHPVRDPHGDPIPTASGALDTDKGQSLNAIDIGHPALIVHVEDEPAAIYAHTRNWSRKEFVLE